MRKTFFTILFSLACIFAHAQAIEMTYHFGAPTVRNIDGYQTLNFNGCRQSGLTGQPSLPWKSVSLLLPQNTQAESIEVFFSDFTELDGTYNLLPQQAPRPLSSKTAFTFAKDETTYRSENEYPSLTYGKVSTQYLNGTSFAFSSFTPVRYIPATGKVSYAQTVKVRINYTASRNDLGKKLWITPNNEKIIKRLAQNDEMLTTYDKRGREINGYDILVVSPQDWVASFDAYVDFYQQRGFRVQVAALEDIYASMTGCDEQEKIRNYVIQEYENNGISMLMLGGDVDLTPFRYLYCYVGDDTQDQLPADMYFACLDGTMNDDGDEYWGEVDEVDLVPEIGVARLPFNNSEQFEIMMHKVFSYSTAPVLGEFRTVILGGEDLGDGYYGSVGLNRLIGTTDYYDYTTTGYPENYNVVRVFASETHEWNADELRDAMGGGGQYVYHDGHAGTDYVAGWYNSTVTPEYFGNNDGINHNFLPFHTHGCTCGNYPEDCIVERLITNPTGCVVSAGNSRFGWYIPFGDGPSDHLCRELVDGYFNDSINVFSLAYRESKIMTAPWVETGWGGGEYASLRWNFYDLNTFGDPALNLWCDEPFYPEVQYLNGLAAGLSETQVIVFNGQGQPLPDFRVSLYDGDNLLGFALTDRNGIANLSFENLEQINDNLTFIVTGRNAWPQQFTAKVYDNDNAFINVSDHNFNGIAEFDQTLNLDLTLQNIGGRNAENTVTTLTCASPFVTVLQGEAETGTIAQGETQTFENQFSIQIADNIEDLTHLILTVSVSDDEGQIWNKEIPLDVTAPILRFVSIEFDDNDGNGDGYIDVAEPITLHIEGQNVGHANAPGSFLKAVCYPVQVIIPNDTIVYGNVEAGSNFSIDLPFTTDENTVQGSVYEMYLSLISGRYMAQETYTFSAGRPTETFESGDFSQLDWLFEGDLPWTITTENPLNGSYCARSGEIDHHQLSRMFVNTELLADGKISFSYKFQTKSAKDYFRFYIDGKLKLYGSGEQDWTFAEFDVEAGEHTFKWSFERSLSGEYGSNCVWIDDITFPAQTIILDVESHPESNVSIFPNPTNGIINIDAEGLEKVTVMNTLGQIIFSNSGTQIDLSKYGQGLYFVQIQTDKGITTEKIIVK